MKKSLLCLLLLACVLPASADDPTLTISPSPVIVPAAGTQEFTATFSDGSQVQSCTWMATGSLNAVQSDGINTAAFGAGTLVGTYVVTASCTNVNGFRAMGIAVVGIS